MKIDTQGVAAKAFLTLLVGLAAISMAQGKPRQKPDPTQNLGLSGTGYRLFLPDPKHPGHQLWKLWGRSFSGNFLQNRITAYGITAYVFKNGMPDAKITAPMAVGDTKSETIVASGGVTYTSLTQKGTYLSARTVTWNARTQRGVARGDVHFQKAGGVGGSGNVAYFDSGLGNVSSEPLGGGSISS